MNEKKLIDTCISSLKGMLGETNNELSSEQRRNLQSKIRELKKLARAKTLTSKQLFAVVDSVAQAALDLLDLD